MNTITRKDIYESIAHQSNVDEETVKKIVEQFLNEFKSVLKSGDKIEFRNFGVFQVQERKAKIARNLKTNEPINLPPQKYVSFKPGKKMQDKLNE